MKSTSTSSYDIKVGLFVVLGLTLLAATIILLGGTKRILGSTFLIHLKIDSVDGLAPGSVVQLSGYPVGNVDRIEFLPEENKLKVDCRIQSEFRNLIREGSSGSMKTQGALGDKYIYIQPGPPTGKPVRNGDWILTSTEGDFFSSLSQTTDKIQTALKVADELRTFIGNFNAEGRSVRLAENLASGSGAFRQSMERLNSILTTLEKNHTSENLAKSMRHLASAVEKIDSGRGTIGSLVNDSTVSDRLKQWVGGNKRDKYLKDVIRDTIKTDQEE